MSTENEEQVKIKEEADGSAIVELPESVQLAQSDDSLEDSKDDFHEDDNPTNDELDALRNAKRERRRAKRDLVRKTQAEKDERLQLLQRQNQELQERLVAIERRTHANDLAQIDKAIEDSTLRLRYANMKLAEAVKLQDGEAAAEANAMLIEEHKKQDALKQFKKQSTHQQEPQELPQIAQKLAENWMKRNPWFDPHRRDAESRIAKKIDDELNREGWNPATQDYWKELDNRLRQEIPHRYNDGYEDESPRRRPRSPVTSSGRENAASAGGRPSFELSAEQVKAMKDAGFWDDRKARDRMVKRYAEQHFRQASKG